MDLKYIKENFEQLVQNITAGSLLLLLFKNGITQN